MLIPHWFVLTNTLWQLTVIMHKDMRQVRLCVLWGDSQRAVPSHKYHLLMKSLWN